MRRDQIEGIVCHTPERFDDERGHFVESYNRRRWSELGVHDLFVQDNESLSISAGTIRGLHFQTAPSCQAKLVRCTRGALLDIAVDLRAGSATFGDHTAVRLDAGTDRQLFIPRGFAHGFCTLEPDTVVSYKVSNDYDPAAERTISWNDPVLGIDWPVSHDQAVLSDKDAAAPTLAELGDTTSFF